MVRIVSPEGDEIEVSAKAFDVVYRSTGWRLAGQDAPNDKPEAEPTPSAPKPAPRRRTKKSE